MTVQELHYAVDQGLQKVGSFAYDNFLPEEIDHWLNRAQDRFIKDRAFSHSDIKQLGFVANQKRLDDISALITLNYVDDVTSIEGAEYADFDLPADYLYLVNVRARTRQDKCNRASITSTPRVVPVRIVNNREVYFMQQDPFARSNPDSPLGTLSNQELRVFQANENFILEGIALDYIRTPQQIDLQLNQTSELADHTHHEIVDIAVKTILEAIESPRYQSSAGELSATE